VLLDLLRHHTWATVKLIEFTRGLTREQRAWTSPGTYGPIDQTLAHIVGGDRYYLFRLTGERPSDGAMTPQASVDLSDLARRTSIVAERYERYAAGPIDPDQIRIHEVEPTEEDAESRKESVGTILAQVLHHGNEHRAQIGTILSAHGVDHPDHSGWSWGRAR
jgi:uncharacterized damage-inducible protein DinB